MDDAPRVEAGCPWCGPVEVGVSGFRCEVEPASGPEGRCEFTCPVCSRLILAPVPAAGVETLRRLGSPPVGGPVPFKLLERHPGPPLSWDDVLDAHVALQRGCCPQHELARSPR